MNVWLTDIRKSFGAMRALDGAEFEARGGRVSALVGENGAGKTTLMRILAGRTQADSGLVVIDRRPVTLRNARQAAAAGVGFVEQECPMAGALSVLENVILGAERARAVFLRSGKSLPCVEGLMETLGMNVNLHAPASTLSASERQRVAVARALYRGARILILDEPTSLLGPAEREALFGIMRSLAASGTTVIFISHKLSEVFGVADTVTVLRRGRSVLSRKAAETTPAEIAAAMVGEGRAAETAVRLRPGRSVLRLESVSTTGSGRNALKEVSLEMRAGEIVGVAGVDGNGQRALCDIVEGHARPESGMVAWVGERTTVASVGMDIDAMDLVGTMKVWENAILGRERLFARWWGIDARSAREDAAGLGKRFGLNGHGDLAAASLSGGNRQRLVLARELAARAGVIVAEEPMRGLDVQGASLARARLREAATAGASILLVSYDLDELLSVADRVLVLSSGHLLAPSKQPPERAEIGRLMAG